jgi:hypothetical protein
VDTHQPIYFLLHEETRTGPFSHDEILKIFRRKDHHGYTGDSLYRRAPSDTWRSLRAFGHFEFCDPDERIAQIKQAGIKYLKWLTAGLPSECEICRQLHDTIYSIDKPPVIPPPGCQCELWCLCMLVASDAT